MARGASRAMTEGLSSVERRDGYPIRVNPAGWKDKATQANADKDFVGSPEDIKRATRYVTTLQNIVDQSDSKGKDWKAAVPLDQYTSPQRAYEVDDSTIRGALNTIGLDGDNIKGIPADRLMRPWMLSSEYFDFSGKKPKQLKPIPKEEPGL